MKHQGKWISEIAKVLKAGALGLVLCGLGACGATTEQMRRGVFPERLTSADSSEKAEIYSEIAAAQKKRNEAYVQIIGGDIELPLTAGQDKTTDVRTYTIDVWFDDSVLGRGTVAEAIKNGDIVVEVLGTNATLGTASYGQGETPLLKESRGKIVISVDSDDLSQSFTVVAKVVRHAAKWQEDKKSRLDQLRDALSKAREECDTTEGCTQYLQKNREQIAQDGSRVIPPSEQKARTYIAAGENFEREDAAQNPYMAVKVIRVFNGDLHTQIYMLSHEETRDAFGTNFAKYFYVGKAYFRNRHTDKKLIVHTTSLRARTVFYREPIQNGDKADWIDKFLGSGGDHGESKPFSRYDYIAESASEDVSSLNVGEEDAIFELVTTRDVITKIIAQNKITPDLVKEIFERTDPLLRNAGPGKAATSDSGKTATSDTKLDDRSTRVRRFVEFALHATLMAVRSCELKNPTGPQKRALLFERAYWLIESNAGSEDIWNDLRQYASSIEREDAAQFARCLVDTRKAMMISRAGALSQVSPLALDLRKRVGLTEKIAASSRDTYWQQRLAGHGYLWQDYYRPMTFEAVLLSLSAKTKAHPGNRWIEYLQSAGVLAGALVGMTDISSRLGSEGFAQRVSFSTGVFVPELKKLIMRDLDQYLANLAATALPSIITLAPNESRDGYVFFPRGPIYGYGVDEFSLNEPSYIVNIDNEDVAVDGALIEGEQPFASGQRAMDMVDTARNQGRSRVDEDLRKLAQLQARIFSYRMQHIADNVCGMIGAKRKPIEIRQYLNTATRDSGLPKDSELITELYARAAGLISCDQALSPQNQSAP